MRNILIMTTVLISVGGFLSPVIAKTDSEKTYYVSAQAEAGNPGSLEEPFKSIQEAVDVMRPGDRSLIRSGRYSGGCELRGIVGARGRPFVFEAFPGEEVIIDGSLPIETEWERCENGIYRARLEHDIWQLFADGEMLTPARWPNASMAEGDLWDRDATWRHVAPESTFGRIVDGRPVETLKFGNGKKRVRTLISGDLNSESLADTGLDCSGAIAVMHIGAWLSFNQFVEEHEPRENAFTFDPDFSNISAKVAERAQQFPGNEEFWERKIQFREFGNYYLEGLLDFLDAEGEWFFDPETRDLYLKPGAGSHPQEIDLRGKVRTYVLSMKNSKHVTFRNIDFFAGTMNIKDCSQILMENCDFLYPSYSKRMLRDLSPPEITTVSGPTETPSSNTLLNCSFSFMDGSALEVFGRGDRIENCLFRDVDYSCLHDGGSGTLTLEDAYDLVFRRNTIHTAGNSEGIRVGYANLVELNNLYNMALLQEDGSAINVGVTRQKGTVIRRNWTHETGRGGIRFDARGARFNDKAYYGVEGVIDHNLVWETDRLSVKGDYQKVLNNVSFDNLTTDILILNKPEMGGVSSNTLVYNNLCGRMNPIFGRGGVLNCKREKNIRGDFLDLLRDPENLDFRPRRDSGLVDAGVAYAGITDNYLGSAPDIGAYEFGATNYWIPGRRERIASTPIPPDGSQTVRGSADLIWLTGYKADSSRIYLGTDATRVEQSDPDCEQFRAEQRNNIFTPEELVPGKRYYWRVDTLRDGEVAKGDLWSFRVAD